MGGIQRFPTFPRPDGSGDYVERLVSALEEESISRTKDFDILSLQNVPWLDVRTYGAEGDGSNDDTAEIQAASDSLTDGGVLFFPEGDWLITSAIDIDAANNITIMGVGWDSRIYTTNASITAGKGLFDVTTNGVRFYNLMLEGDGTETDDGVTGYALIRFYTAHYGLVQDCYLYNLHTYGVLVKESYGVNIRGNTITGTYSSWDGTGTTHAGICTQAGIRGTYRDNYISGCVQGALIGQSSSAVNIDGDNDDDSRNLNITDNKFYNNMNHHIYATNAFRCHFDGNIGSTTIDGAGFRILGSHHSIEGNTIIESVDGGTYGGVGIAIIDPENVSCCNNTLIANDDDAIRIKRDSSGTVYYININNNIIRDAGAVGINFVDNADLTQLRHCIVANNIIENCGAAGISFVTNGTPTVKDIQILGNNIKDCDEEGIDLYEVDNSVINNNVILNSGTSGTNKPGIELYDCLDCIVMGNRGHDNQGTKTQTYVINSSNNSDYLVVVGNDGRGSINAAVNLVGANNSTNNNI